MSRPFQNERLLWTIEQTPIYIILSNKIKISFHLPRYCVWCFSRRWFSILLVFLKSFNLVLQRRDKCSSLPASPCKPQTWLVVYTTNDNFRLERNNFKCGNFRNSCRYIETNDFVVHTTPRFKTMDGTSSYKAKRFFFF